MRVLAERCFGTKSRRAAFHSRRFLRYGPTGRYGNLPYARRIVKPHLAKRRFGTKSTSALAWLLAALGLFGAWACGQDSGGPPELVAEGFGAESVGGAGGEVLWVTNLNDTGPGSFREAVMAEGPRIVKDGAEWPAHD